MSTSRSSDELDEADPLRRWRAAFHLPRGPDGAALAYLCGHSLGAAPRTARALVTEELSDWERLGVLGHESAARPWVRYAEALRADLATIAGARDDEVVAMGSLTANLHELMAAFFRPEGARCRILIEAGAFPSDRYAVRSQLRWHGLDPAATLVEIAPRPGEELLRIEDIEARIAAEGPALAFVLWPGVQYRTGQAFDLARIATATHRAGAVLCADLAHAIGNVPLALHEAGVDCAAWCSYKYLNAGPGAIGGLYVHRRHHAREDLVHFAGWWGHEEKTRFRMPAAFAPSAGAAAWQLSNPPILSTAPLLASLALFRAAGFPALCAKSRALTAFLAARLDTHCGEAIELITPRDPAQRGAQLSLRLRIAPPGSARTPRAVFEALLPLGVVADWREPDVIRLAPAPLYNSYADAERAARALADAL